MELECDECGHLQWIGMVEGGFSGIPDPHAVCEECGAVGRFHSHPGMADCRREQIDRVAAQIKRMKGEDHIERGSE